MSKIFSPNAESSIPMKRFESGVKSSVPATLELWSGAGSLGRHLALGRSFHSDQWQTTLSLASRGSRRRRDWHPGSATS